MKKLLIFAGTTEGREAAVLAASLGYSVTASVATEYGKTLMPEDVPGLSVHAGRLDEGEMEAFLAPFDAVIDATHPYAVEVSANIRGACLRTGKKCLRLLRERGNTEGAVLCASLPEAAALAGEAEGNILAATGSKEISLYSAIPEFATRVYARVLPTDSSVRACREAGLSDSHILAARGPFSLEQNLWTLKRYSIKSLVTKDGGDAGGFAAKAEAARQTGCTLYVVRRPEESGLTPAEVENLLKEGL